MSSFLVGPDWSPKSVHLHTIPLTLIGCLEWKMIEEGRGYWGGGSAYHVLCIQYYTLLVRKGMTTSTYRSNSRYLFSVSGCSGGKECWTEFQRLSYNGSSRKADWFSIGRQASTLHRQAGTKAGTVLYTGRQAAEANQVAD